MRRLVLIACLFVLGPVGAADAGNVWVAGHGIDTVAAPHCGAATNPCRSITKALELAHEGDTITVLPGRYGSGIETTPIIVGKRVTLVSRDGPDVTLLAASPGPSMTIVVITASRAVFGRPNKGFTLIGGSIGLHVGEGTSGVMVAGNVAIGQGDVGFDLYGSGSTATDNRALSTRYGFVVNAEKYAITGNVARGNEVGFLVGGFGHRFTGNFAMANWYGIEDRGSTDIVVSRNVIAANAWAGIYIEFNIGARINQNNIYDNGFEGGYNCGVCGNPQSLMDARHNFWGAPTGPGPDPADNLWGGPATTTPFAVRPFVIRAP